MKYVYDTGGREHYYKQLDVQDCVTRALAIANNMDYKEAYKLVWSFQGETPRNGVGQKATDKCYSSLGWKYKDLKKENKSLKDYYDLEKDVIFRVRLKNHSSTHVVAYINGEIRDSWNTIIFNPEVLGWWEIKE